MRCVFRISYVIFVVYIERNIDEPNELNSVFIHTKKSIFILGRVRNNGTNFSCAEQLSRPIFSSAEGRFRNLLPEHTPWNMFVGGNHQLMRYLEDESDEVPTNVHFFSVKITEKKGGFYHVIAYASKQIRRRDEFRK